jgi:hypothetical protein
MTGLGEPGTGSNAPMPMPTQAVWAVGENTGGALAVKACCPAAIVARQVESKSWTICRFL